MDYLQNVRIYHWFGTALVINFRNTDWERHTSGIVDIQAPEFVPAICSRQLPFEFFETTLIIDRYRYGENFVAAQRGRASNGRESLH
jgi:hypothetical protein